MKIKNILLVCLVVIACSFLLPEKNVMSQSSVDGGDIVMMNIQNGKITLVYHKPSNTFLFYGYPSSDLENEGLQKQNSKYKRQNTNVKVKGPNIIE